MDRALIDHAATLLDPDGVYLRAADIRCKEGFTPPFIDQQTVLVPQYRGGPKDDLQRITNTNEETGHDQVFVHFYFGAGVRLVDKNALETAEADEALPDNAVYLEIESEFLARYGIELGHEEDTIDHALQEFARYDVGYHVWPYWREYVQSTCARLGLPPIPIPMYRIPTADLSADR